MYTQVKNFIDAAEKLGIEVDCSPNWEEEGDVLICFTNVFDSEGETVYIMVSPNGKIKKGD